MTCVSPSDTVAAISVAPTDSSASAPSNRAASHTRPIGPLFLVNFAVATVLGVALLVPVDRWVGRWGGALVALAAAGGLGLAAGSLVLLTVAERRPLFGVP